MAVAAGVSAPGGASLTLRVRMPDGAVKRVKATATDTVDGIMSKLGMAGGGSGGGEGLSTDAGAGGVVDGSASVATLGLGNGDFLYVKVWYVMFVCGCDAAEAACRAYNRRCPHCVLQRSAVYGRMDWLGL